MRGLRLFREPEKFLWIVALAAFLIRVGAIVVLGANRLSFGDERTYWKIAQSIISGKGFSIDGVPTASVTPGYPLFVAITSLIWKSPVSVKIAQALLGAAAVFLVYKIASNLGCRPAGIVGAVFYAIYPPQIYLTTVLYPQLLGTIYVLFLFYLFLKYFEKTPSPGKAIFLGILTAAGAMIIPMLLVISIIPLYRILRTRRLILLAILGIIIAISPWAIRNSVVMHKFIPLSSNGWMNLWAGNCQYTTPTSGSYPIYFIKEGKEISQMGEISASNEYRRRAIAFIVSHPGRTLYMYFLKFLNFWRLYPVPITKTKMASWKNKVIYALFWLPVLISAILSFLLRWKDNKIKIIAFSILLFAAAYAVFFTRVRFRQPIEPLLICVGSVLVCQLFTTKTTPAKREPLRG